MKKIKNLINLALLPLGTTILATVSCNSSRSIAVDKTKTPVPSALSAIKENPIEYSDVKIDPIAKGIAKFGPGTYGFTMMGSFLINLAEKLGFNHPDQDNTHFNLAADANLNIEGYQSGKNSSNSIEQSIQTAWKADNTLSAMQTDGISTLTQFGFNANYEDIKTLEPITDLNAEGASNHASRTLPANFSSMTGAQQAKYVFALIGGVATSDLTTTGLTFSKMLPEHLPEDMNGILYSIETPTSGVPTLNIWLTKFQDTIQDKNLEGQKLKDAINAVVPNQIQVDAVNNGLANEQSHYVPQVDLGAEGTMYIDEGNNSWGRFNEVAMKSPGWTRRGDGRFAFNNSKFQVYDFCDWIDATKPGFVKLQANIKWLRNNKVNIRKTWESPVRMLPEYSKATSDLYEEILKDTNITIMNLQSLFAHNTKLSDHNIRSNMSDMLLDALQFLSDGKFTPEAIKQKLDELNNGSFDMYALEYSFRGLNNIPNEVAPEIGNGMVRSMLGLPQYVNKLPGFMYFKTVNDIGAYLFHMDSSLNDQRLAKNLTVAWNSDVWKI